MSNYHRTSRMIALSAAGKKQTKNMWEMTLDEFSSSSDAPYNGKTGTMRVVDLPARRIRPGDTGEAAVVAYMEVLQGKGDEELAAKTDRPYDERLKRAISAGGEIPITVDYAQKKVNVVDGQHRLEAYRRLGYERVPVEFTNTMFGVPAWAKSWPTIHESIVQKALAEGNLTPDRARELGHFKVYPHLRPTDEGDLDS